MRAAVCVCAIVAIACGTATGPAFDASAEAADAALEAGVCSYERDDGTHVDCSSTQSSCPDPNPACGNDCTCEYSFDGYYLTCHEVRIRCIM